MRTATSIQLKQLIAERLRINALATFCCLTHEPSFEEIVRHFPNKIRLIRYFYLLHPSINHLGNAHDLLFHTQLFLSKIDQKLLKWVILYINRVWLLLLFVAVPGALILPAFRRAMTEFAGARGSSMKTF